MKITKQYLKQIILEELTAISGGGAGSGKAIGRLSDVSSDKRTDNLENFRNLIIDLEHGYNQFVQKTKIDKKSSPQARQELYKKLANVLNAYNDSEDDNEKNQFNKLFVNRFVIKNNIRMPKENLMGWASDYPREKWLETGNIARKFLAGILLYKVYDIDAVNNLLNRIEEFDFLLKRKGGLELGKFVSDSKPRKDPN